MVRVDVINNINLHVHVLTRLLMCPYLSELLEAPSEPNELEAVTKAKILYRSCMNESESNANLASSLKRTLQ